MKLAKKSFGQPYECKMQWPEDCFVQCGEHGIVLKTGSIDAIFEASDPIAEIEKNQTYITAFFEAFPKNPDTFLRWDGDSIEAAEQKAWNKLQRYLSCPGHEFERQGYENGAGFCKHCNMFKSKAFDPLTKCTICDKPTYHRCDNKKMWYCEEHRNLIPEENMHSWEKRRLKSNRITDPSPCAE